MARSLFLCALALLAVVMPVRGQEGVTLLDGNGATFDAFGQALALDGDVLVVGSPGDSVGLSFLEGSVTVFRRELGVWVQQQEFTLGAPELGARLGSAVAVDGDVLVVGAPANADINVLRRGQARVYRWNGASYVQELALAGAVDDDRLGEAVAVEGDLLAVGVPGCDASGMADRGAVRLYRWNGAAWIADGELPYGFPAAAGDAFGSAVAIDDGVIVVGAPLWDQSSAEGNSQDGGAVYVFRPDGGGDWTQHTASVSSLGNANLGRSVAIDGDLVVGGAPELAANFSFAVGGVAVSRWDGQDYEVWTAQADPADEQEFGRIGTQVGVSGEVVVASAPGLEVDGVAGRGAALVLRFDGDDWVQDVRLSPAGGLAGDSLAGAALEGDLFVTGSPGDDISGNVDQGSVTFFEVSEAWTDQGSALAGIKGDPELIAVGSLLGGSTSRLRLQNAIDHGTAGLFLGFSSAPVPFKGGTLVPAPLFPPILLTLFADGWVDLALPVPTGVPGGGEIWVQFAIVDGAAPFGVALSNAVAGSFP